MEREDERVEERSYDGNHHGNHSVVIRCVPLLGFHIQEQAAAVANHNTGEVGGAGRKGFPPARGRGNLEDSRDYVGVGDNGRYREPTKTKTAIKKRINSRKIVLSQDNLSNCPRSQKKLSTTFDLR